jgi:hypothetical protein
MIGMITQAGGTMTVAMVHCAADTTTLPVPAVPDLPPFAMLAVVLLIAAVVLLVAGLLLLRRRSSLPDRRTGSVRHGSHSNKPDDAWHADLEQIRSDYHAGTASETQTYARLSALARDFASDRLGADFSSSTLLDLNRRHQIGSKEQFQRLRQTIAALYPPEFAPDTNPQAHLASVDQAADWVADLLERWDR